MANDDLNPQTRDGLQWLSDNIGKVSTLIATLVGLPSLLFTCSSQNIERNKSFQSAVLAEEQGWKNLYDQYLETLALDDSKSALKKERFRAICEFSRRSIPDFREFTLGEILPSYSKTAQNAARDRIDALKKALVDSLKEQGINQGASRCEFDLAEGDAIPRADASIRETPTSTSVPPKVTKTQIAITKTQMSQMPKRPEELANVATVGTNVIVSVGSARGYDVDIFWCRGAGETDRFERANMVANSLGSLPNNRLSDGNLIGRIRLRPLSVETQKNPFYPSSGYIVRGDSYEKSVVNTLVQFLNSKASVGPFIAEESGSDTRWYLSAFVCS